MNELPYTSWSAKAWRIGIERALPIMLGYLPVGFAFGVLAVKNGLTPGLAVSMAVLMFSGSGQFVFVSLWGHGADFLSTAIGVAIVNLRYLLMSAAEAPWFTGLSRWRRFFLSFGITDESFVVHATAVQNGWRINTAAMFVCNQSTQLAWISGCAIGSLFGGIVDDVKPLGLDYAITAMFIALLIPQCVSKNHLIVAIFTICLSTALKASGIDQWYMAVATVLGATLGLMLEMRKNDNA